MMEISEIQRWLATLHPDSHVAIGEMGLELVEVAEGEVTEAYLEIGGVPEDAE